MTERAPLDPPDAEELEAAAALEAALDGRSPRSKLPEAALETAALLRFSGERGGLDPARQRQLRAALLDVLPERPSPPARAARWWAIWLPLGLVGAAAAVMLAIGVGSETKRVASQDPEAAPQDRAAAPQAERSTLAKGGMPDLAENARRSRAELLSGSTFPALTRAHALADTAQARPELEAAEQALTALVNDLPAGLAEAQAHAVRQDLFCRLAEVALRSGQPRAALEWTRQGLELDGPASPFLAQLFALDGQAHAALGEATAAAQSYMKALSVNERLLDQHLEGDVDENEERSP